MTGDQRLINEIERSPRSTPLQERRRHHRVKVSLPVRIRGGAGAADSFEDMVSTIDVARAGLLIQTARGGYFAGQSLEVTYPYSSDADAINSPKRATVVRVVSLTPFSSAVALKIEQGRADRASDNGQAPATVPQRMPGCVHVLLVDSDLMEGERLRAMLDADGYQVAYVDSAGAAFDVIKSESPDVIVAEVECGEPSGHDLCAIVKKSERHQHIPVILMMRSASPADYATSHELGAVVCLAKPFKPERLRHMVQLVAAPPEQRSAYSGQFSVGSFVRT